MTSLSGAAGAQPVDREVREAGVEAERFADHRAGGVELLGVGDGDLAAGFANEVLAFAFADQAVEAWAVTEVHVAHDAELLEALEVAIDRRELDRAPAHRAVGDLLGRGEPV